MIPLTPRTRTSRLTWTRVSRFFLQLFRNSLLYSRQADGTSKPSAGLVTSVECVERRSVMFYRGTDTTTFLRVQLARPSLVTPCSKMIQAQVSVVGTARH